MEQLRFILLVIVFLIGYLLWKTWGDEHPPVPAPQAMSIPSATNADNLPALTSPQSNGGTNQAVAKTTVAPISNNTEGKHIRVKTDVLDLVIDSKGGDIVQAQLPAYPKLWNTPQDPVVLFNNQEDSRYLANSILVGEQGFPSSLSKQAVFVPENTQYQLDPGQDSLKVVLHWQGQGLAVDKEYVLHRGKYTIDVNYRIRNMGTTPWQGNLYSQLLRVNNPPVEKNGFTHAYFGASLSSADTSYKKISFKDMDKLQKNGEPLLSNPIINKGWVAMQQHYFLSAWVPPADSNQHVYSQVYPNNLYAIGMMGPQIVVTPGQEYSTQMKLYVGPEINEQLQAVSPKLNLTIDYGFLWPISLLFLWVMTRIYNILHNWGWSIVILTILIKLAFYKLSSMSYKSMAKMRELQPKMAALKERFGDDKQKMSQATMELYKSEKVNPLGGCLPIAVQIPFFIALYWVLAESVALRQAPFILWIHDLSLRDPYYILPILMIITMFVQQKLSPTPPDPMQAKMMMVLPLVFGVLFMMFPAGLVLYWVVNNTVSILQQWYITRNYEKAIHKSR
ncbi:MAG: yidC [Gammaproteobacteria bacterium]|jgi:YidC/Oxa1 family membrane protein insertase|nr:yidC [Gammaproteobacteria bacterium]